jgi:GDP-L-fucose synthase
VVPALVRKFVEATLNNEPEVVVWGTGNASREFLYVGDAAQVIVDVAERIDESGPFNLGTGVETTVKDLVVMLTEATGYTGRVVWDASRPDGQRRRYYDMRLLKSVLGYVPNTPIADGIAQTVDWYKEHRAEIIARDDDEMRA